ncbi:MAG: hypothetical protein JWP88_153 [Flaviaesturariibacter sp.]|nr:hypothetical protein [Flaviaesturariibacter sp.]
MDNLLEKDKGRIQSIDFLRGLIMIVMALDHVRDFFHITAQTADPLDPATTTPALFFTRWITHFCAPTFVFLSGVSAYLSSRNKTKEEISLFLIKRGFWLVVVDLVIMSFALTFDPAYHFIMLTVLWAIGWSMTLLGITLRLSARIILPIGLLLFFGHDLYSLIQLPMQSPLNKFLGILFTGRVILPVGATHMIGFFYAILPWTGVMFLGYWFGRHINHKKAMFLSGMGLIALFFLLRLINNYGEPVQWKTYGTSTQTTLSFFNATKYPPSLQFLAMTLGPSLLLLSMVVWKSSALQRFISTYGKVPFFYYVVHFLLARVLIIVAFFATGHTASQLNDGRSPFLFRPFDFGFSLPVVYLVWVIVVAALYYPCRWFYRYKLAHKKWWLRYL